MILKHGNVVVVMPVVEVRSRATGQLATPPSYRVVVEDRELDTITLEPVSKGLLQALAPERYEQAVAELKAYRDANPIRTAGQVLEDLGL